MREKIFIFKQIDRSTLCHEFKYSSLSIRPIRLKKKTLNCLSHLSQSRSRITNKGKSDDRTFVKKKKIQQPQKHPTPKTTPRNPPPHQKKPTTALLLSFITYNSIFNSYTFSDTIFSLYVFLVLILMNFQLKRIFKFYLTLCKDFNRHF